MSKVTLGIKMDMPLEWNKEKIINAIRLETRSGKKWIEAYGIVKRKVNLLNLYWRRDTRLKLLKEWIDGLTHKVYDKDFKSKDEEGK